MNNHDSVIISKTNLLYRQVLCLQCLAVASADTLSCLSCERAASTRWDLAFLFSLFTLALEICLRESQVAMFKAIRQLGLLEKLICCCSCNDCKLKSIDYYLCTCNKLKSFDVGQLRSDHPRIYLVVVCKNKAASDMAGF